MIQSSVYLLEDDTGLVKVGASYWGMARIKTVYSPRTGFRRGVLCTAPHSLAYRIEADIKRELKPLRFKGEWFECSTAHAVRVLRYVWKDHVGSECDFQWACRSCHGWGRCGECKGLAPKGSRYREVGNIVYLRPWNMEAR